MARMLADRLGVETTVGFPRLRQLVAERIGGDLTFVTATAANHGRGVAWAAGQFGCRAVVFVPRGTPATAIEAIRVRGARVEVAGEGFEEVVDRARRAAERNGWALLQDTAWEGYETIPAWVMQGYGTMVLEALEQVAAEGLDSPTHVFLQVGVGSFAAAVAASLVSLLGRRRPAILTIEPTGAAPLYASVDAGRRTGLERCGPTAMSCLACSEVSLLAWPVLRDWSTGHFTCDDEVTALGQETLASPSDPDPRVVSGPSGAVGVGALVTLCRAPELRPLRRRLHLDSRSRVLLFSTEGTPPPGAR
jgi:diaminopropionate ammonia-lyase